MVVLSDVALGCHTKVLSRRHGPDGVSMESVGVVAGCTAPRQPRCSYRDGMPYPTAIPMTSGVAYLLEWRPGHGCW